MQLESSPTQELETRLIRSAALGRNVQIDCYLPPVNRKLGGLPLLLVNDGQDLVTMNFAAILDDLYRQQRIAPVFCIGIHCGEDRKNEYGMLVSPDFKGRGARAAAYRQFIFTELLPALEADYLPMAQFGEKAMAGFSLGGLSALDLAWNHPDFFRRVGVFSGSLWWRSKSKLDKDFHESTDRLMHRQVREATYLPALKFFFECGELDETEDRNKNGVIDSIDDTIDLMRALAARGYQEGRDFRYLQLKDGRHDVNTWAHAMPVFLEWGYGLKTSRPH